MPFGKYKGRLITELPLPYLQWFKRKGFPKGKLGMLLQTMYEIKVNGLDYLLDPIKEIVAIETKREVKKPKNDG